MSNFRLSAVNSITTLPKPTCDLCGSSGELAQSGIRDPDGKLLGEWSFRRCTNSECGAYWLDPALPKADLWKAYTSYHTHAAKSGSRPGRAILSLLHRGLKLLWWPVWMANGMRREAEYLRFMTLADEPVGRLLDVGCGAGRLLRRMQRRGWSVEGVDFDEQAANKAMKRYGIKVHIGDLAECAIPDASFDVISLSQTVEHLFDPRATLQECLRILKPGGLLVMTTPNVQSQGAQQFRQYWRGWEPPRHLHLFTVASLQRLTTAVGFNVVEARSYSAGSAVVYRASNKLRHPEAAGSWGELSLLRWSYRQELLEYLTQNEQPNSGQNVLIRARKPIA